MKKIWMAGLLCLSVLTASAEVRLTHLRVNGLTSPMGIDRQEPVFSWRIESDERGYSQKSYELTVTERTGEVVWSSGVVESSRQTDVRYEGSPLQSRHEYRWTLRVTGNDGSVAEAQSAFETAFMSATEWTARWIGTERGTITSKVEIKFDEPVEAQYLRLNITRLGLQAEGDWNLYYAQFAEVEIYSGTTNVARTATFTPSSAYPSNANWQPAFINDGIIGGTKIGYTSQSFNSIDQNVVLTFNFGSVKTIDRVVLYPRQDVRGRGSSDRAANFPSSYTIQTSSDGTAYTVQYTASNAEAPLFKAATDVVPMYGRAFSLEEGKIVRRARIYATALGVMSMQMNGQAVTLNRLEPGETGFDRTIHYSTYDVTSLLKNGSENVWTAMVAGGLYNILEAPERYSKPELHNTGIPSMLAELFIDYEDGTTQHIVTDGTWRTAPSPITAFNWWGGVDWNDELRIKNEELRIDVWEAATVVTPTTNLPIEKGGKNAIGTLVSRQHEPVRVVEEWKAKSVTALPNGHYVVDFGQNFAGTYRFTLPGKAGQTLKMQTSEQLNADGSVNAQGYYGGQIVIYNTYTFANDETVTWEPDLLYFGFRYMEISGLTEAPTVDQFTAQRMRLNVEATSRLQTSNTLINQIHEMCRHSVESQIFNVFTDCPQREKMGWLDVPNQMYNSIADNFDFQTFGYKIVQDCFDAQKYYTGAKAGKVPSTVPHFFTDWDDDPNWGGSAIFVPYRTWRTYDDPSLLSRYYDGMKRLIDYYTSLTSGYIMPGSSYSALSDWGQGSSGLAKETTAEFTITCTYYYLLRIMAEMATETGRTDDAQTVNDLADHVREAFNNRFYDTATATYEFGNQAELAMPLYYGLVPETEVERVAAALAEKVMSDNYKIKTGECGLKPVLMSLARYGYNDIVWRMACQTDYPSYGYFVQNGCTTTPELWNMAYSQNHCMLDHIEEWFYSQLAGIQNDGLGYDHILIAPYVPTDLNHLSADLQTVRGLVHSEYTRLTSGIRYRFTIPANTTATLRLTIGSGQQLYLDGEMLSTEQAGVLSVTYNDTEATVVVASGSYELTAGEGEEAQTDINEVMWLPIHGVDRISDEGTVLRIKDTASERFIGECSQFPVATGNYLTGATRPSAAHLSVSDQQAMSTSDKAYQLSDEASGLFVGGHPTWNYMVAWQNNAAYHYGFDFAAEGTKVFRTSDLTAKNYFFFTDGGEHSGISTVATADKAPLWEVQKRFAVNDSAATALQRVASLPLSGGAGGGLDVLYYERQAQQHGGYEMLVLPFDLSAEQLPADYEFFLPTRLDGEELGVEPLTAITAGQPCLMRYTGSASPSLATLELIGNPTVLSLEPTDAFVRGTYTPLTLADFDLTTQIPYVPNTDGTAFVPLTTAQRILPFRACLMVDAHVAPQAITVAPATGIASTEGASAIPAQPTYYTLTGIRLSAPPSHGVYLQRQGSTVKKIFYHKFPN